MEVDKIKEQIMEVDNIKKQIRANNFWTVFISALGVLLLMVTIIYNLVSEEPNRVTPNETLISEIFIDKGLYRFTIEEETSHPSFVTLKVRKKVDGKFILLTSEYVSVWDEKVIEQRVEEIRRKRKFIKSLKDYNDKQK